MTGVKKENYEQLVEPLMLGHAHYGEMTKLEKLASEIYIGIVVEYSPREEDLYQAAQESIRIAKEFYRALEDDKNNRDKVNKNS